MAEPDPAATCRICLRSDVPMTYEHVPPRAAGNDERLTVYGLDHWLGRDEERGLEGGRIEQRGAGARVLCEDCNNKTGSWYGNELALLSRAAHNLLARSPLEEFDSSLQPMASDVAFKQTPGRPDLGPHPLRIAKQIVSMMLATSPPELARLHPDLPAFVLDRERTGLPDRYQLYLALFAGPLARQTGIAHSLDVETGAMTTLVEVAFPPLAYVLTIDAPPGAIHTLNITPFVDVGYDTRADIDAHLLIGFGHTPYPADYRSRAMLERDRNRADIPND